MDRSLRPGEIRTGTSGWQYADWQGPFYPKGLAKREWLGRYAADFASVELNASFYRLPAQSSIERWRAATPEGFLFSVKAPRALTHFKKLKGCEQGIQEMLARLALFGDKLGPILFQLPPRWHVNVNRLEGFLAALPDGRRYVLEPRDQSWQCEEVYTILRAHRTGLCIAERGGTTSAEVVTGDFVYLRLHGPDAGGGGNYRAETLRGWAARALNWARTGRDVYLYFDNDQRAHAVRNARRLVGFLAEGVTLPGVAIKECADVGT